jgi:hypothetical protein
MRPTLPILLAVVSLSLGSAVGAAAMLPPGGTFVDDDGSVHEADIEAVAEAGITRGCNPPLNDRFCPDDPVTRAQMAAFLVRALGLTEEGGSSFVDTDGVFARDVDRLATAGVTRGCDPPIGDRFCPGDPVTRAQMASFLTRALGLDPIEPPPDGPRVGSVPVPPEARAVDTSDPDIVIGDGTPAGCTSDAVVEAVAQGGIIVFDCGPHPLTIEMAATARVFNDARPDVVIDGGGLITLSGGGERRILYMNTCDPDLVWTTSHCQDQDHPRLTIQRLTLADGNASGLVPDGGGAVFARGGRIKVVDSRFVGNRCDGEGPDVAGGAIRVFDQHQDAPIYVVGSTFGGPGGQANVCSNGGAVAGIGVSWTIVNSTFSGNAAVGMGANPARPGTPGGGNGGAVYGDGNRFVIRVEGTVIQGNDAREGGGAVFFVSNDRSGDLVISESILSDNPSHGFETAGHPGVFFLGRSLHVTESTLE